MEMKRLVIEMPAIAMGHMLNGLAGPQGYVAVIGIDEDGKPIPNPVSLEEFALGILQADLLARAQAYNVADQERQAREKIREVADATAAQLLPLVKFSVEDAG